MNTFAICTVCGGLLMVLVSVVVVFLRRQKAQEEYMHCRCPACQQKIRYALHKAGKPAQCPRCPERFNLPSDLDQPMASSQGMSVAIKRRKPIGARIG